MDQEKRQWKVIMALLIAVALMTFSNALMVLTLSLDALRGPGKLTTDVTQSTDFGSEIHNAAKDISGLSIELSDASGLVPEALDKIGDFSDQLKEAMSQIRTISEDGGDDFVSDKEQTVAMIEDWIMQLKYWRDRLAITCGLSQVYEFEGECSQVIKPDGTPSKILEEICFGTQADSGKYCPYPDPYDAEMTDLMDDFIHELELIRDAILGIEVDQDSCVLDPVLENKYAQVIGSCYSSQDDFKEVTDELLEELNKYKDPYIIRLAAIQVSSGITYLEKVEQIITSVNTLVNNPLDLLRPILGDRVVDTLEELIGGVNAQDIMNWVEVSVDERIEDLENDMNDLLAQLEPKTICKLERKTFKKVCEEVPVSDELRADIESQIQIVEEKTVHYKNVKANLNKASYVLSKRVMQNFEEGEQKLEEVKNELKGYGINGQYTDQEVEIYLAGLTEALNKVTPSIMEALGDLKKGMGYLYDGTQEDIESVDCVGSAVTKENMKSFEDVMNVRQVCGDFIAYSDAVLKGFEEAKEKWGNDENVWAWQGGVLQSYNNLVIGFADVVYETLGKVEAIGDEISGKIVEAFETFVGLLQNISDALEQGFDNFVENVLNPFLEKTTNVLECVQEVADALQTCKEDRSSCPDVSTLCLE